VKPRNGRVVGIVAVAVFVTACVLIAISGSSASATFAVNATLTPWAYLPLVCRQELPMPHNLSARSIVLQPSDLPGYTLAEAASGPADFLWEIAEVVQMGLVDGYRVWYNGTGDEVTIYELATVFQTSEGAHSYIQWEKENRYSTWEPVSCPTLGDETTAYCGEDQYWALCDIVFRKGNLAALLSHGGVPGKVKFSNALSIARVALARINSQVAGREIAAPGSLIRKGVAEHGTLTPQANFPYVSRQEPPTPHNLRARSIVLQLSDMPPGYALDEDEPGPVEFSNELLQMGTVVSCFASGNARLGKGQGMRSRGSFARPARKLLLAPFTSLPTCPPPRLV